MVKDSTAQEFSDLGMQQGRRYAIVITGAQSNVALQFQHGGDSDWHEVPGFDGSQADVIYGFVFCFSPYMRLVFEDAPSDSYTVSCISEVVGDF